MFNSIEMLTNRLLAIQDKHKLEAIAIILDRFLEQLEAAEKKHPQWTNDPIHAVAIMNEESGEATKAAIDFYHKAGHYETLLGELDLELMQTGAMAIRTSLHIDDYQQKKQTT